MTPAELLDVGDVSNLDVATLWYDAKWTMQVDIFEFLMSINQ